LALCKSLAGFLAALVTGTAIAFFFWSWFVPAVSGVWDWTHGMSSSGVNGSLLWDGVRTVARLALRVCPLAAGLGWAGLAIVNVFSGLVTGITETLGVFFLEKEFWAKHELRTD
jgi:diacylglycerol kinase (CTP)